MSSVTGSLLCSASTVSWLPKLKSVVRRQRLQRLRPGNHHPHENVPVDDLLLRGGGGGGGLAPPATTTTATADSKETIRQYLQDAAAVRKFHIQGWRWHTMSLARETERLQKLALRLAAVAEQQGQGTSLTAPPEGGNNHRDHNNNNSNGNNMASLEQAADYVVNFNLKALHRVEAMFFPWIRKRMDESPIADDGMKMALSQVMDELQADQQKLAALGERLLTSIRASQSSSTSATATMTTTNPALVARQVALQSRELLDLTKSMLEREVTLVIPTVGLCIPEKEQKKFNNQVISFLGVLESRTHLVHMHEVVAEADNHLEHELWRECIPKLPRSMIPRWKRTLYAPRASMLDIP